MCGRFAQQRPASELAEIFAAEPLADDPGPRFNVAPTDEALVVVQREERRAITAPGPNAQRVDLQTRVRGFAPEELWRMWLDPLADRSELRAILEPNDDTALLTRPVSRLVNNARNDGPALIEPMAPEAPDHA